MKQSGNVFFLKQMREIALLLCKWKNVGKDNRLNKESEEFGLIFYHLLSHSFIVIFTYLFTLFDFFFYQLSWGIALFEALQKFRDFEIQWAFDGKLAKTCRAVINTDALLLVFGLHLHITWGCAWGSLSQKPCRFPSQTQKSTYDLKSWCSCSVMFWQERNTIQHPVCECYACCSPANVPHTHTHSHLEGN